MSTPPSNSTSPSPSMRAQHTLSTSRSLGYCLRGEDVAAGAVVAQIPTALAGEQSICGLKAFLIDERRCFDLPDGPLEIDCAKVAALDITDSPVHVHAETTETYHILAGNGQMLLGDDVVAVGPGSMVVIPPGVRHGLVSNDPHQPMRVVMTFTPGLAPIQHAQVRDEQVVTPAASVVIADLQRG